MISDGAACISAGSCYLEPVDLILIHTGSRFQFLSRHKKYTTQRNLSLLLMDVRAFVNRHLLLIARTFSLDLHRSSSDVHEESDHKNRPNFCHLPSLQQHRTEEMCTAENTHKIICKHQGFSCAYENSNSRTPWTTWNFFWVAVYTSKKQFSK